MHSSRPNALASPVGKRKALHAPSLKRASRTPIPGDPDGYPARDEVIAYLEHYGESFGLPVKLNSDVDELDRGGDGRFRLEAGGRAITANEIARGDVAKLRPTHDHDAS